MILFFFVVAAVVNSLASLLEIVLQMFCKFGDQKEMFSVCYKNDNEPLSIDLHQ